MATEKTGVWKIYALAMIAFMVGTSQFCIVGMLDKVAVSVGVSISTAGQLVTVYALSNAIGTPVFMIFADRMGQKKKMLIALGVFLLGVASMLSLQGFGFMVLSRAITGLGAGIYSVTAYGMVTQLAEKGKQGRAVSTVAMGSSSSLVFGVPLGRMISTAHGWKAIFWVIGLFCVAAVFLVHRIIPNIVSNQSAPKPQTSKWSVLKTPQIAAALCMTLFVFIGFSIVDTYITPYLNNTMPSMQQNISIILMLLGVGSLIGSRLGGFLADRIGISQTITGALIAQIICLAGASFVSHIAALGILVLMLWEISCWTFGPIQNFNLMSMAPSVSAIALSLNSTFVQVGIALGAGIGGFVVKQWSVASITGISALSALIAVGFLRSSRASSQKQWDAEHGIALD